MGDRLATMDMDRKVGRAGSPSSTMSHGPRPASLPSGILIHPAVLPQGAWAENWRCALLGEGKLGPHPTQFGLGRGLPPCQVLSGSIQPFGYNRHGPQIIRTQAKPAPVNFECGGLLCSFPWGGAGFPPNTMWPGPRPTCMPSFILIRPTVWPQYTNVTDRQTGQTTDR